jgi:hypothetical protein
MDKARIQNEVRERVGHNRVGTAVFDSSGHNILVFLTAGSPLRAAD